MIDRSALALLDDHVEFLTGFPFKSAQYLEKATEAVRLLRGDNVAQGVLRWEGAKHWPVAMRDDYSQFALAKDDVILAMDRPWIEAGLKWAWVRESDLPCLLVQRVARLRGRNGLTTEYLRYIIGSPAFTDHVKSITTGVNIPHISGRDIKRFQFRLPEPATQRRIVSILGAYDDLIEVNRRRIAVLEEMARRLFDEWFGQVASAGGTLPPGWRHINLGSASQNFDRLRKPLSKMQRQDRQGPYPYFGAAKVFDYIDDYIFEGRYLLVAEDGSVIAENGFPVLQLTQGRFWVNNHAHILRGLGDVSTEFLYLALRHYPIRGHITGAAQPKITQENLNRIRLAVGPPDIMKEFSSTAAAWLDLIQVLETTNVCLKQARDLLLPRLISGDLSVITAEREQEEAA